MALAAGEDLDQTTWLQVERHLAECPECREFQKQMTAAMDKLLSVPEPFSEEDESSLWPAVAQRIEVLRAAGSLRQRAVNWMPLVAVTAACLLVAVVSLRYTGVRYQQPTASPFQVEPTTSQYKEEPAVLSADQPADKSEELAEQKENSGALLERGPLFRWPRPESLDYGQPRIPLVPVKEVQPASGNNGF